ncbi:hypothetical protein MTBBW1_1640007 [Desulfamplus magnetovallimortis]|uniref:Uncharacterized protein n=1 Tax=Desulfamplus magnetovallimortis TaxID=1246637 RepID=A0A1W1H915_9BACT|nr:hypothetical protein MTBBW1_1640007 [Desulfamplus magnetovallimortis]
MWVKYVRGVGNRNLRTKKTLFINGITDQIANFIEASQYSP